MPVSVDASDLHGWLYVSECRLPPSWVEATVTDIVAVSRTRNATLGVTGALLFTGRRFAQFVEGPSDGVAAVRDSIERDARHAAIRTVLAESRQDRQFDRWSLAYAGSSLFVSTRVESALDDARSADDLLHILREFATQA